jgi:hypothetical protein
MPSLDLAHEVYLFWQEQSIERPGVSASALDDAEARLQVKLPPAFRALWQLSDGTSTMDEEEFIFWPLDNVVEEHLALDSPEKQPLVFADFRLCARVFQLQFRKGRPGAVTVTAATGGTWPVADRFEDFLDRYLDDPWQFLSAPHSKSG